MSDENQNENTEQPQADLPEQSEVSSNAAGVPANEPPELGTVIAPDEPDASRDEQKLDGENEGGVPDETPRKADASPAALAELAASDGELTHEHLDQIEARNDVTDVRYLTAFLRKLLGEREAPAEEAPPSSEES